MIDAHHGWNVSFKPVVLGFLFSLILTFAAYRITIHSHLSSTLLTFFLLSLGVLQALLQLLFFLHLGIESKPRWNLMMFLFTFLLVVILIGGSLWIMDNLSYNGMEKLTHLPLRYE